MNPSIPSNPHMSRARQMMSQSRYEPAIKELLQHLAICPEDAVAFGMLGVAQVHVGNTEDAIQQVNRAIAQGPEIGYCHWARAYVLCHAERYHAAEDSALDAVRIAPRSARYYGMLGQIRFHLKNWHGTLEAAEAGITVDPENGHCRNLRALALLHLGKKDDANEAISSTLSLNPDNATTHANQGWICLERGEIEKALIHFREALRINPATSTAGSGIAECLACRLVVYRLLRAYFQWMAKRSTDIQRSGLLAYVVVGSALTFIVPHWLMVTVVAIYALFIFLLCTGRSTFDFLLRFDPLGRAIQTPQQIKASNWVVFSFVSCVVSALFGLTGKWVPLISAACFLAIAWKGAAIGRCKGPYYGHNIFCAVMSACIVCIEAASLITRNDTGWPLFAIMVVVLPATVYGIMLEQYRRNN